MLLHKMECFALHLMECFKSLIKVCYLSQNVTYFWLPSIFCCFCFSTIANQVAKMPASLPQQLPHLSLWPKKVVKCQFGNNKKKCLNNENGKYEQNAKKTRKQCLNQRQNKHYLK